MHSTDSELRNLLTAEESSQEMSIVSSHVENCEQCQQRLQTLSGLGNWSHEVVAQLKSSDCRSIDSSEGVSQTVVEQQPSDSENLEIEIDPLALDFLSPPCHPELLGRLGRYDIERVIGAGGMGVVLKAYDAELHRPAAIKVLAPHLAHSAPARRRFSREAQATAAVIHPHVIPIYNVESDGKVPYIVMRYVSGQSLQMRVDQSGPMAIADAVRIALQTAAGLAAAHAQGLIHRDVKPANILLDEGIERVVLSDFGLARTVDDASLTRTGVITGTPHYMSPEQAGGDSIDCRSDLFSLGCVLWFMLTGRPPFRAATAMGVLNRICHESHRNICEVNNEIPMKLAKIIDRLLAKNPEARNQSAENVQQELSVVAQAIQSGRSLPTARKRRSMRRLATGLAAVILCPIALLAALPLIPNRKPVGNNFANNIANNIGQSQVAATPVRQAIRSSPRPQPLSTTLRPETQKTTGPQRVTGTDVYIQPKPFAPVAESQASIPLPALSTVIPRDDWQDRCDQLLNDLQAAQSMDPGRIPWFIQIEVSEVQKLMNELDTLSGANSGANSGASFLPQGDES